MSNIPSKEISPNLRADLREVKRFVVNGPQYEQEARNVLAAFNRLKAADLLSEFPPGMTDPEPLLLRFTSEAVKPAKAPKPADSAAPAK